MAGGGNSSLEMYAPLGMSGPEQTTVQNSPSLLVTGRELRKMHSVSMRIAHRIADLVGLEPAFRDSGEYVLNPERTRYQEMPLLLNDLDRYPETDPEINNN
jgi:hypothetical protein